MGTPCRICPPEQHGTRLLQRLHCPGWQTGSVALSPPCLVHLDFPRRAGGVTSSGVHPARCCVQGWTPAPRTPRPGSVQRSSSPSPLPPLLLNLFKLGERGEEVRPFGEAT